MAQANGLGIPDEIFRGEIPDELAIQPASKLPAEANHRLRLEGPLRPGSDP